MTGNRIFNASGKLTEDDMLDMARLLVKAGYAVKAGKQKLDGKLYKYIECRAEMEELSDGKTS